MNWVENGIPPEEIIAERVDPQTGESLDQACVSLSRRNDLPRDR